MKTTKNDVSRIDLENKILILNLDDEIDFDYLRHKVNEVMNRNRAKLIRLEREKKLTTDELIDGFAPIVKVKDIAVDIVNAILRTKK